MLKTMQLILLPFAGGSSYSYYTLTKYLPGHFDVIAIDTPGHGRRINEALLYDCNTIAGEVIREIEKNINPDLPYALFGHSMGALLGHILLRKAQAGLLPLPVHFFASGRQAPSCPASIGPVWELPPKAFRERLKEFDYTPEGILNSDAIMNFFEPILRADFRAVEQYRYTPADPVHVPITVLAGRDDNMDQAGGGQWQQETTFPLNIYWFEGKHFFIFEHSREVCNIIADTLRPAEHQP